MFMVYWTVTGEAARTPHQQLFGADDMGAALQWMEHLRTRQRAGEGIGFITMASENPDSVGHAGVDVTGSDYSWTKRRRRS